MAFLNRNYRRAAEVHFAAGWVPADRSIGTFAQACRSIGEPILDKPVHEISIAQLLGQLFRVTATFGMETQPDLLLLQKSMLVAEGTSRALCPEANFWMLARPLIEDWIAETMGPEAQLREAARAVREALVHMPETVRRLDKASRALAASAPSPSAAPDRRSGGEAAVIWLLSAAVIVLMVLHILD